VPSSSLVLLLVSRREGAAGAGAGRHRRSFLRVLLAVLVALEPVALVLLLVALVVCYGRTAGRWCCVSMSLLVAVAVSAAARARGSYTILGLAFCGGGPNDSHGSSWGSLCRHAGRAAGRWCCVLCHPPLCWSLL